MYRDAISRYSVKASWSTRQGQSSDARPGGKTSWQIAAPGDHKETKPIVTLGRQARIRRKNSSKVFWWYSRKGTFVVSGRRSLIVNSQRTISASPGSSVSASMPAQTEPALPLLGLKTLTCTPDGSSEPVRNVALSFSPNMCAYIYLCAEDEPPTEAIVRFLPCSASESNLGIVFLNIVFCHVVLDQARGYALPNRSIWSWRCVAFAVRYKLPSGSKLRASASMAGCVDVAEVFSAQQYLQLTSKVAQNDAARITWLGFEFPAAETPPVRRPQHVTT